MVHGLSLVLDTASDDPAPKAERTILAACLALPETAGQENGETVEEEEQRGRVKVSGVVVLWSLVVHP